MRPWRCGPARTLSVLCGPPGPLHDSPDAQWRARTLRRCFTSAASSPSSATLGNSRNTVKGPTVDAHCASNEMHQNSTSQALGIKRDVSNIGAPSVLNAQSRNTLHDTTTTATDPSASEGKATPTYQTETEMVTEIVQRLRIALQHWTEAEKVKYVLSLEGKGVPLNSAHRRVMKEAREAVTSASGAPPEIRSPDVALPSQSTPIATDCAAPAGTPTTMATSSTSWVRDKKHKFWSYVYPGDVQRRSRGVDGGRSAHHGVTIASVVHPPLDGHDPSSELMPASTETPAPGPVGAALPSRQSTIHPQTSTEEQHFVTRQHGGRRHVRPVSRNRLKREVTKELVELLNHDPLLGPQLLSRLSADSRRLLLVMGTASEYFSSDVDDVLQQVKQADRDKDSAISSAEYEEWALTSFQNHQRLQRAKPNGTEASAQQAEDAKLNASLQRVVTALQRDPSTGVGDTSKTAATEMDGPPPQQTSPSPSFIPWPAYLRLFIASATPFLAFGAIDNATLIFAGDAIDRSMSASFGLSQMAAAGLGGVVSGVAGIQVHGLAEKLTRSAPPPLTAAQRRSNSFLRVTHLGNTTGIVLGLLLGMLPLLFIGDRMLEDEKADTMAIKTGLQRRSKPTETIDDDSSDEGEPRELP